MRDSELITVSDSEGVFGSNLIQFSVNLDLNSINDSNYSVLECYKRLHSH